MKSTQNSSDSHESILGLVHNHITKFQVSNTQNSINSYNTSLVQLNNVKS